MRAPTAGTPRVLIFESYSSWCSSRGSPRGATQLFSLWGHHNEGPTAGTSRVPTFDSYSSRCSSHGSPREAPRCFLMSRHNEGLEGLDADLPLFFFTN